MRVPWCAIGGLAVFSMGLGACGIHILDRWGGGQSWTRTVAAPPDRVWERLSESLESLDLLVEEVRPEQRVIQFGWVTAPGDGGEYLVCSGARGIGSASLRPRVIVKPVPGGSEVAISAESRATAARGCESRGVFERWLLERFEPAITAAADATQHVAPAAFPDR